jgi:hypothetical protein
VLTKFDLPPSYKFGSLFSIENDCFRKQSNALLDSSVNTAVDFRARLRFPRAVGEPPRLRLRGLTLATSPAGVFVLHSNQQLERIYTQQLHSPKEIKSYQDFL